MTDKQTARPKHTPEPWHAFNLWIGDNAAGPYAYPLGTDSETAAANAERLTACVNACAGLNPEAIPALVEAVSKAIVSAGQPFDHPDKRDLAKSLSAALAAVRGEK